MTEVRGVSTPFRFQNGRVAAASGDELHRENLVATLFTGLGERVMRRDFGGGLEQVVQEPDDDVTRALVMRQVAVTLGQWLPEIELRDVAVVSRDDVLLVDVTYVVRGAADVEVVTVPVSAALR